MLKNEFSESLISMPIYAHIYHATQKYVRLNKMQLGVLYESLSKYLDMIGIDFNTAINKINSIPKLWYQNPRF